MEALELQDIHLPQSADFWPLAIGWWILLVLVLITVAWFVIKAIKLNRRRKRQAKILARFSALEEKLKVKSSNTIIAEINTLLRQLAITYYPREKIASLTGGDWLQFLDESGGTQDFSRGAGRILIEAPYRSEKQIENLNINEFLPLVKKWIKKIVRGNHE